VVPTDDDGNDGARKLTGTVIIDGVARVGMELTANTETLGGDGAISYQWQKSENGDYIIIDKAAGETYTPSEDDIGRYIKVMVTRAGYTGGITSRAKGPVKAKNDPTPALSGMVTIDGETKVGEALFANTENLDGEGTFSYQWQRSENGEYVTIDKATGETYTPSEDDIGRYIKVMVTRAGYTDSITSRAKGPVKAENDSTPALSSTVTIDGETKVGEALFANTENLDGGCRHHVCQRI
jgi:hypothetical protein